MIRSRISRNQKDLLISMLEFSKKVYHDSETGEVSIDIYDWDDHVI